MLEDNGSAVTEVIAFDGIGGCFGGDKEDVVVIFAAKEVRLMQTYVVLLATFFVFLHFLVVKIFFITVEIFDQVKFIDGVILGDFALVIFPIVNKFFTYI